MLWVSVCEIVFYLLTFYVLIRLWLGMVEARRASEKRVAEIQEYGYQCRQACRAGDPLLAEYFHALLLISEPGRYSEKERTLHELYVYWEYQSRKAAAVGDLETAWFYNNKLTEYSRKLDADV